METLMRRWGRPAAVLLVALSAVLPGTARAAVPPGTAPAATPPVLVRPVGGAPVRAFDAPPQPWLPGHRGADLAARPGDAVVAASEGRVVFAGWLVDRGVVSIDHGGGYRTTYEPVHAVVRAGDRVGAGQVIGYLTAGHECAEGCLHWGLRHGSDYLDPLAWLATTGVRLLPDSAQPAVRNLPTAPPALMPLLRSGPLPPASGALLRPAQGPVTSPFGMRLHPVLHIWKLHDGEDFGAPCGAPVRAAAAGRVLLAGASIGYGNRVVVEHGSIGGHAIRTAYNHLSSFAVTPGQVVAQGQLVGAVGTTGFSTGCHLHFMVWSDGQVTDPARYVR